MITTTDQYGWDTQARDWQKEPSGWWRLWLIVSEERGIGKTTAGVEWIRKQAETGQRKRLALVGPTIDHAICNMIENSSILHGALTQHCPLYESLRRRLRWTNGVIATIHGADDLDALQGVCLDGFFADDVTSWPDEAALGLLISRLRLGDDPRGVITATPPLSKEIEALTASTANRVTWIRGIDELFNNSCKENKENDVV